MAERELNLSLTARDSASTIIRGLESELARIEQRVGKVGAQFKLSTADMLQSAALMTRGIREQIASLREHVAALDSEVAAQQRSLEVARRVAAERLRIARESARAEAETRLRVYEAALGPDPARRIPQAAQSGAFFAQQIETNLGFAAYQDAMRREVEHERQQIARQREEAATAMAVMQRSALGGQGSLSDVLALRLRMMRPSAGSAEESAGVFTAQQDRFATAIAAANARAVMQAQEQQQRIAGAAAVRFGYSSDLQQRIDAQRAPTPAVSITEQGASARSAAASREAAVAMHAITAETSMFAAEAHRGAAASRGFISAIRHLIALFDEFARGQRGAMFSSVGAAMRDAGIGAGKMAVSVGGLVAVMGTAALFKGAEEMGKWAHESEAGARATGMTINQFTRLQQTMVQLGESRQSADVALRQFARAISEATGDPASKAAQALRALGVDMNALRASGGNTHDALMIVMKALQGDKDSADKAAWASVLFGKGLEHAEEFLGLGTEGLKKLGDNAQATGNTLSDETARRMEEVGDQARQLGYKFEGQLKQAFVALAPAIEILIGILGGLAEAVGTVGRAIKSTYEFITDDTAFKDYLGSLEKEKTVQTEHATASYQMKTTAEAARRDHEMAGAPTTASGLRTVPPMGSEASVQSQVDLAIAQAKSAAGKGIGNQRQLAIAETKAEIGALQAALQQENVNATERERLQTRIADAQIRLHHEMIASGAASARQSYLDFAGAEREKIAAARESAAHTVAGLQDSTAQIQAIYREWETAAKNSFHVTAAEFEKVERERINAAREAAREIEQAQMRSIEQDKADTERAQSIGLLQARARAVMGGRAEPTDEKTEDFAATAQTAWANFQSFAQRMAPLTQSEDPDIAHQAQASIQADYERTLQVALEAYGKAESAAKASAEASAAAFKEYFNKAGAQLDQFSESLMKALIAPQHERIRAGLTTITRSFQGSEIRQAGSKLFFGLADDLVNSVKDGLLRLAAQKIALNLGMDIGEKGGMGDLLGQLVGNMFGMGAKKPDAANFGLTTQNLSQSFNTLGQAATQAATSLKTIGMAGGAGASAANENIPNAPNAGGNPQQAQTTQIVNAQQQSTISLSGVFGAVGAAMVASHTKGAAQIVSSIIALMEITQVLLTALNIKPSILGFTYAGGGVVSAAGGMVVGGVGGGAQVAILHDKEMVLPKHLSEGVQGMINRNGGANVNQSARMTYSPTVNMGGRGGGVTRAEISSALAANSGAMVGEMRNMVKRGWRP